MSPAFGPQPLREVIAELLAQRGYGQNLADREREDTWQEIVGIPFRDCTCTGKLRRGVLQILVGNSVALQELTMQKTQLLREIHLRLPQQKIRDLRFRIAVCGN